MFTITKDMHFSASHQIMDLPDGHPCGRVHGHNFIVRLHLSATELDHVGFVTDYNELRDFQAWLDESFDHHHLNEKVDFNPTAENMCRYLYKRAHEMGLTQVSAVSWSETPKTWATYEPEVA